MKWWLLKWCNCWTLENKKEKKRIRFAIIMSFNWFKNLQNNDNGFTMYKNDHKKGPL